MALAALVASSCMLVVGPAEIPAGASPIPSCGSSGTPSVVALQDPNLYIDGGQGNQIFSNHTGPLVFAGVGAMLLGVALVVTSRRRDRSAPLSPGMPAS